MIALHVGSSGHAWETIIYLLQRKDSKVPATREAGPGAPLGVGTLACGEAAVEEDTSLTLECWHCILTPDSRWCWIFLTPLPAILTLFEVPFIPF